MPRLAFAAAALGSAFAVGPLDGRTDVGVAPDAARIGPPWISIEYPANPHDPASRGALLVVNTFHHGTTTDFSISGTAEGVVNGERRTQKLEFRRTSRTGVHALHRQWPTQGTWVLVISTHGTPGDGATALVSLTSDGTVASVEVPTRQQDGWSVPRAVSRGEVDALLARRVAAR